MFMFMDNMLTTVTVSLLILTMCSVVVFSGAYDGGQYQYLPADLGDTANLPALPQAAHAAGEADASLPVPVDAAPTITSIERFDPEGGVTASQSLLFRVHFSEPVAGVDLDDFVLSPGSTMEPKRFTQAREVHLSIPDMDAAISDTITVADSGDASSVSVGVGITHQFISDLVVDLIAPDGTAVNLHDRTGLHRNDIDRTYTPDFNGTGIAGDWTLRVRDASDLGIGTLDEWALTIEYEKSVDAVVGLTGSGSQYLVSVSALRDGTYNLDVVPNNGIADMAGDPLNGTEPAGSDHSYVVETGPPEVASIERSDHITHPAGHQSLVFGINFSEPVRGVDAADFVLSPDDGRVLETFTQTMTPSMPIPDNSAAVLDAVTIDSSGAVRSVSVDVDISHTHVSDLSVVLIAPDGTIALLHDRAGAGSHDINQTYAPDLAGTSLNGDWALRMNDAGIDDTGTLNEWTLSIEYDEADITLAGSGSRYLVSVPATQNGTYNLDIVPNSGISDLAGNPLSGDDPPVDQSFQVAIPDSAPVTVDAGPDQTVMGGQTVALNGTAAAANGDPLTYSWTHDSSLTIQFANSASPSTTFAAPQVISNTTLTLTLTAGDGTATVSDSVDILIIPTQNAHPILGAIPEQAVDYMSTLAFVAGATDEDSPADTLTYGLEDPPAGASMDPATGEFTWTPAEDQDGTHTVTVTVSDGRGGTDSQDIKVTVNAAPIVDAGADHGPPTFVSSELDIDAGVLTITFSETIDAASIVPTEIHVRESGNYMHGTTLTAGELDTAADGATISFALTGQHRAAVGLLVTPELTIEPGAMRDASGNPIVGTFDASTRTFVDATSIRAQETQPRDIAFSNDGTKMFIVGDVKDNVNEYDLSTPFDASTRTFVDATRIRAQDHQPRGMAFSNDGTKLFVVGYLGDNVNEYALSTPFDASTMAFVEATRIRAQEDDARSVAFSNDGTKMFVMGVVGVDINEYALSTPFDASTGTFVDATSISSEKFFPTGMVFSNDGAKLFVIGWDEHVSEYALSTPFDASTMAHVDDTSISSEEADSQGIAFSNDGAKMFIIGIRGDDVNEYDLHSVYPVTVTRTPSVPAGVLVTTWNAGASPHTISMSLDMYSGGALSIDWGDNSTDTVAASGMQSHTYAAPGEYRVSMTGDLARINLAAPGSTASKLASIDSWTDVKWSSMEGAFRGASGMAYNAVDAPDLSRVASMQSMFHDAASFDGNISSWNVSSVTGMEHMLYGASDFNGDISEWDTSSVTDMEHMLYGASDFNGDISEWDTSSVTDMGFMFGYTSDFNGDISEWDTSSVTDMSGVFFGTSDFNGDISEWDTSSVTDMEYMFFGTWSFNQDISGWNVSSVETMSSMFTNAIKFKQNLGNWYIVLDGTSIDYDKVPGVVGRISAQNSYLDGQNPAYGIGSGGDSDSFELDGSSLVLTAVPSKRQYAVNVTSTGDFGTGNSKMIKIAVSGFSTPPAVDAGPDQTVAEDSTVNLDAMVTDPDSEDTLTYSWSHNSTLAITLDDDSFEDPSFTAPNVSEDTPVEFTLEVYDGAATVSDKVTVTIRDSTNTAPTVDAGADFRILDGSEVTLNGTASDADGDTMTYSWIQTGGTPVAALTGSDTLMPTFTVPDVSSDVDLTFQLTVGDGTDTVNDTVTITVHDSAADFVTTWKTTSASEHVRILLGMHPGETVMIDWGDGSTSAVTLNGRVSHEYSNPGEYKVTMTGGLARIYTDYYTTPTHLASIDQWGDIRWSTMEAAFQYAINMEYEATDVPDLSGVSSMDSMFHSASKFNGNLSGWDVSSVTDMDQVFSRASSFNGDASTWNVSSATSMGGMFFGAASFNSPIDSWDVSSVTDMGGMFFGAASFNSPIDSWDVSSVTNMHSMFYNAEAFNSPIDSWDVSSVTHMEYMFRSAASFNSPIDSWDVSSVTDMYSMFRDAASFNSPIDSWDVSSVTDMHSMFRDAASFNSPIDSWDVSSVTDMHSMFYNAASFNSPIDSWDVSSVTNMHSMFYNAEAFNSPIDSWDVSSVTDTNSMFYNAASFNSPIDSWDVSSVTDTNSMFYNAAAFNSPIELLGRLVCHRHALHVPRCCLLQLTPELLGRLVCHRHGIHVPPRRGI